MSDIFKGVGIEVKLENEDAFLKVRETLTRIGVSSRKENKLYQSCHILHKQGRYVILHFKELFKLDGKKCTLTESDVQRRNTIVNLLAEWRMLKINNELMQQFTPLTDIKIIPKSELNNWKIVSRCSKKKLGITNG